MQVQTQNTGAPAPLEPYFEMEDDYSPRYVGVFGPFSVPTLPPIDDDGYELVYTLIYSNYGKGRRFSVIVRKVVEVSVNLDKYYEIEDALMDVGRSIVVSDMGRIIRVERQDKNIWYILDKDDINNPRLLIFEEYEG